MVVQRRDPTLRREVVTGQRPVARGCPTQDLLPLGGAFARARAMIVKQDHVYEDVPKNPMATWRGRVDVACYRRREMTKEKKITLARWGRFSLQNLERELIRPDRFEYSKILYESITQ